MDAAGERDPWELLELWLATTPYDEDTRVSYRREVGSWIEWAGPRVWHAGTVDVATWAARTSIALRSTAHRVSAVWSWYAYLKDKHGFPHANPAEKVSRGPVHGLPGLRKLTRAESAALTQAADRYTGPYAPRDRALVYLLLGMNMRPGQISELLMQHLHPHDQAGPSVDVPQKGSGDPTRTVRFPPLVWLAVRDYLRHRKHCPPYSYEDSGPLLTTRAGRPLDPYETPLKIVRRIAKTHELLADFAHEITSDGLARSASPWE